MEAGSASILKGEDSMPLKINAGIDSMALGSNEVDGCIDEIRSLLLHATTHEQSIDAGSEHLRFQVLILISSMPKLSSLVRL
jgi:hypothetical protein